MSTAPVASDHEEWFETQKTQYAIAEDFAADEKWSRVIPIVTELIDQFCSRGAKGLDLGELVYSTALLACETGKESGQEEWGLEMQYLAHKTLRKSNNIRWATQMETHMPASVVGLGVAVHLDEIRKLNSLIKQPVIAKNTDTVIEDAISRILALYEEYGAPKHEQIAPVADLWHNISKIQGEPFREKLGTFRKRILDIIDNNNMSQWIPYLNNENPLPQVVYVAEVELHTNEWKRVVQSARNVLIKQGVSKPTSTDMWSMLCQTSNAGVIDDTRFFGRVMGQHFYPRTTTDKIIYEYASKTIFTSAMQIFLNASYVEEAPIRMPWYRSVDGETATHIDDSDIKAHKQLHSQLGNILRQSEADVDAKIATASALQLGRLNHNHAGVLTRPRHALFLGEHASTHECVVNDPNKSSMQHISQSLLVPHKELLKSLIGTDGSIGFCQTWSLFEIECNIMECAGIHEQLRDHYRARLKNRVVHTNASDALEAALKITYADLATTTALPSLALALLEDKLCRRFAHIFNYKYPVAESDWPRFDPPPLPGTTRRHVAARYAPHPEGPMPYPSLDQPDGSNASYTKINTAYRADKKKGNNPYVWGYKKGTNPYVWGYKKHSTSGGVGGHMNEVAPAGSADSTAVTNPYASGYIDSTKRKEDKYAHRGNYPRDISRYKTRPDDSNGPQTLPRRHPFSYKDFLPYPGHR